jgi:hypothetical protein
MIVKIYTGEDEKSHFEDIDASQWPSEWSMKLTNAEVNFRRRAPGFFYGWHNVYRRQYVITLSGQQETTVGDGMTRRFGPGDVILAVDLTGQGHTTKAVGDAPWVYVTIPAE